MKWVCNASTNNEFWENSDFMLIDISPENAQWLKATQIKCVEFLKSQGSRYCGVVQLEWDAPLVVFGRESSNLNDAYMDYLEQNGETYLMLPINFELAEACIAKTELHKVVFHVNGTMRFRAISKYGPDAAESYEIPNLMLDGLILSKWLNYHV